MDGTDQQKLEEFAGVRDAVFAERARRVRDEAAAAGELVWDPFDPAWRRDPPSVYRRLLADNPVHKSPLGFWVFTRHADCMAVLRDKRSSADAVKTEEAFERLQGGVNAAPTAVFSDELVEMIPFLFRDPPDHTRLRGLVQKAFTPKVVEALRPRMEEICTGLLEGMLEKGSADLVTDYAFALPVQIIVEMLGVPMDDLELFRTWSDALARGLDPDFLLPPEAQQQRLVGIMSFVQYFASLIEERRARLGDDLLSRLITVEEEGQVLSQVELISTCMLLLVAGHETTVNLISGGALALMEHPEQLRRFADDPSVQRSSIEELMRWVCPVQLTGRVLLAPLEVGGVSLDEGEFAWLLLGAANRDPAVFADPEYLDLGRADNPQLGFGFGIHHCLGAPLARVEAHVALRTLFSLARSIEPDLAGVTLKENVVLRGLEHLPVALGAA